MSNLSEHSRDANEAVDQNGAKVPVCVVVDARALRCPMPLLKLKQALHGVETGQVVELLATDAGSWRDIPVYASLANHEIVLQEQVGDEYRYQIRRG